VRVVSWNVRQGGGRRAGEIAAALVAHAPDVAVICEYRPAASAPILAGLRDAGLVHAVASEPRLSANGVAVCARTPLRLFGPERRTPLQQERWLDLDLPEAGFSLVAVYVPPIRSGLGKPAFWAALLEAAERLVHEEAMLVGDLNTGRWREDEEGATFACEGAFRELGGSGWTDAWRSLHPGVREYSHGRPERGHRIDHAFLSPSLAPRLRACRFSHAERDELRLSDHSPLLVDLAG
jgi:exonuclease III